MVDVKTAWIGRFKKWLIRTRVYRGNSLRHTRYYDERYLKYVIYRVTSFNCLLGDKEISTIYNLRKIKKLLPIDRIFCFTLVFRVQAVTCFLFACCSHHSYFRILTNATPNWTYIYISLFAVSLLTSASSMTQISCGGTYI